MPATAELLAPIPVQLVPFDPQGARLERARHTNALWETLRNRYHLTTDDPIMVQIDFLRDLEGFMFDMLENFRAVQQDARKEFAETLAKATDTHGTLTEVIESAIKALQTEHKGSEARLVRTEEGEAVFRQQLADVLAGMVEARKQLPDVLALQLELRDACKVLTKRAFFESILNYLLPIIALPVGGAITILLLLKFGWIVQQ